MRHVLRFLLSVLAIAAWLFASGGALGQGSAGFDHATTGFIIDTPHRQVPCDACHISGILRGTPRDCQTCHAGPGARAIGKPATHIPSGLPCANCHRPDTPTWSQPSGFTQGGTGHPISPLIGVTQTNCQTCHNGGFLGANADTKPAGHIQTAASCGTCHGTTSWKPATNPHAGVAPGSCANCHGSSAPGKRPGHIPTSASCDTCHTNFVSFSPAQMSHAGMAGQCSSCHSGAYVSQNAQSKPATHIVTTGQCDTCHKSTTTWATAVFDHTLASPAAAGRCSSCHNGTAALGKPSTHIPTSSQCDTCHTNFASFKPAQMNHTGLAGQCSTCHNGRFAYANALGKVANHIPVSGQCDTCHSGFVSFFPAQMNHAGMTGQCSNCHSGAYVSQNAQTKPATHISTTGQCDSCHKSTTTWATTAFDHTQASPAATGRCSTCHNGTTALGKPTTHIPTSSQCDACHTNYVAFKPAQMNHTGLAGQCGTCHNGAYKYVNALGKPATHIPTSSQCDTCHTNFVAFSPAQMSHAGLTGQCSTCHSGTYVAQNAQMKPATHLATTAQCDTCHKSTTTWATVVFDHALASPPAAGRCSACHNGTTALGKPTTHIPTASQCDACHTNYVAFKPAQMNHTGLAGQCGTCHSGAYTAMNALGKPTTHIPTSSQCDSCHTGFAAFFPALMNHAGMTGQCSNCHSGTYLSQNAQMKPATHLATTAQCDTCHKSTTTWATSTFDHALASPAAAGRCSTCHNGTTAIGKPTTHIPTSSQCDTCHSNFVSFKPAQMNHTGLAGQCSTCHNGAYKYVNVLGKPATHIPTSSQCDTCHTNFVAFKPAQMNHTGLAGQCTACHNGAYTAMNALNKPATHIPTSSQCDSCHTGFAAFFPAQMNHAGLAGQCSTCHSGAYVGQNAQMKPATHLPTSGQCDTCHKSTVTWATAVFDHTLASPPAVGRCATCHNGTTALGKPTTHIPTSSQCDTCHSNYVAFKPAQMNHGGLAGLCTTCHSGAYTTVNALSKPGTHIPTSSQCDTCHKIFTAFSPAQMNHAGLAGQCSTCHSGAYVPQNAQMKPATHIATTAQCDTCHKSTTSWATAVFDHTLASPPAAGRCSTCHNGTTALGKPTNHIPMVGGMNAQCDTCHRNYVAFAPATMSHAGTTGQCASCHGGTYTAVNAQAKPATHITTSQSCDICHTTSAWKPTSFAHQGVQAGTCINCHDGIKAAGKPSVHIPTSQSCDVCHRTGISWLPLITPYGHSGIAAGTCSNCHGPANYPNIDVKPATHLPTTASCDACHTITAWTGPYRYNHAGVTTCATCHVPAYTGIVSKPGNHIPTTLAGLLGDECGNCHSKTVFTSFATGERMNHGTIQTGCPTCHDTSTPYNVGVAMRITRGTSHHNSAGKDCSSAGCHKPKGTYGSAYTKWN